MASTDLIVRLLGDTRDLKRDLNKATGTMAKFKKTVSNVGAGLIAAFGTQQIIAFGKESLRLFDIQAKNEARLLSAVKGRADVQQRLIRQAQTLQKSTLFGDEETIAAQAQLATLGLTEQQIASLIPLVQDLSAATGRDLKKAAKEVTTAVATGSTTLEKYGVSLSSSNTLAKNLELTINGLSDSVGGQAVSAANSGTGAITQLSNSFGDLQEKIGEILNRQGGFISFLDQMTQSVTALIDAVDENEISFFDKLTSLMNLNINPAGISNLIAQKAAIDAQKTSLEDLRSGYHAHNAMLDANAIKIKENAKLLASQRQEVGKTLETITETPSLDSIGQQMDNYVIKLDKVKTKTEELNQVNIGFFTKFRELGDEVFMNMEAVMESFAGEVLSGFAEDLGNAATGVGTFGENIISAVSNFMKRLGEQMIQLGIAKAVLEKLSASLPGGVLIAAGVALVAASTALSNTLNKGISGGGGGVSSSGSGSGRSSGTGVGFGFAERENRLNVNFIGKISGQDLIFVQEKAQRNRSITGG